MTGKKSLERAKLENWVSLGGPVLKDRSDGVLGLSWERSFLLQCVCFDTLFEHVYAVASQIDT